MTERPFLPHDLGTRNDPKMVALELDGFAIGKAIWWDLLEMLYEQGGKLPVDYKSLAYILRYPKEEDVRHLVEDFNLFEISADGKTFSNASAKVRIQLKADALEKKRAAGSLGGRSRGAQASAEVSEKADLKQTLSTAEAPLKQAESTPQAINQSNKSNKSKESIKTGAGAGAPAREGYEDYLMYYFFMSNWIDPVGEVKRCLQNYGTQEIKNIGNVAKAWHPEKNGVRFEDPRSLDLAFGIYRYIHDAANPHEAVEFLRHVDAIEVDKGRNEVKIRMVGSDWGISVQGVIDENPALVKTFDGFKVTKRANS